MEIKYAVTQWSLPGNFGYSVKYAAEAGLDGMQIELGALENGYYMAEKKVQNDYLEDGKKYGIEYPSLVLNCLSIHGFVGDESEDDYKIAMESLDLSLDVAESMKIGMIMVPQFWGNEITDDRTFENTVKVMKKFCGNALERGIKITSETILAADRQIELMKAVDMPNLSTLYDSQNYHFFYGYDQKEVFEKLYPYISDQVHIKDGIGLDGKGGVLSGALLGEGDSDVRSTADILKKNDFKGWLILENYYYLEVFRTSAIGQFGSLDRDVKYLKSLFT
jgi:sugar phosphate isomerase/epimerase